MNASFRKVVACLCGLLAYLGFSAVAAPRVVEAFDGATWSQLQASLQRPAVVVFSTTDCTHCPAAMESLAREIHAGKLAADLVAVVMNQAPGEADAGLLRSGHYRRADRLFSFAGSGTALRYSVNPEWRGVTPFIAFLVPHERPVWVTGIPSASDVAHWVKAGSVARISAR